MDDILSVTVTELVLPFLGIFCFLSGRSPFWKTVPLFFYLLRECNMMQVQRIRKKEKKFSYKKHLLLALQCTHIVMFHLIIYIILIFPLLLLFIINDQLSYIFLPYVYSTDGFFRHGKINFISYIINKIKRNVYLFYVIIYIKKYILKKFEKIIHRDSNQQRRYSESSTLLLHHKRFH